MKFHYLLLAVATLSLAPVLPSCMYSQMLNRQEDGMATLNRTLASVQDKATADAAAPAVRQYGAVLRQDIGKIFANGRPSLIQLAMLKNSYQNSNIKQESKSALGELFRIYSQGFYGSTELRQAFLDLLKPDTGIPGVQPATAPQIPSQQNLQKIQEGLNGLKALLKPAA